MAQIDTEVHNYLATQLDENSVVIDVGAHTGWLSKGLCNDMGGSPKNFYLIEACPNNFEVLKQECADFNLFNLAISDTKGTITLFTADDAKEADGSSQSNSLFEGFIGHKDWNPGTVEVEVDAIPLNMFCNKNNLEKIDYLKINCEGGEYKILSATANLKFLERVKYLYLQMHGKEPVFLTPEMLEAKLRINRQLLERGFRIKMGDLTEHIPTNSRHIKQFWVRE